MSSVDTFFLSGRSWPGWHHSVALEGDSIREIDLPRCLRSMIAVDKAGANNIADPLAAVGVGVEGGWFSKRYLQVSGQKEPSDGYLPQVTQGSYLQGILQDYRN